MVYASLQDIYKPDVSLSTRAVYTSPMTCCSVTSLMRGLLRLLEQLAGHKSYREIPHQYGMAKVLFGTCLQYSAVNCRRTRQAAHNKLSTSTQNVSCKPEHLLRATSKTMAAELLISSLLYSPCLRWLLRTVSPAASWPAAVLPPTY